MKAKLLFVLSTLLALAPAANAQWGYGYCERYPTSCLVQGNLNLVQDLTAQHRWTRVRGLVDRTVDRAIDHAGYAADGYYPGGYLYDGGYRGYDQPIGRRERNVSLGTAVGLGVYGATGEGGIGLAAGAGTFGLLTAVDAIRGRGRDEYGRPKPVDCSKRKLNRRERETREAITAEQERREAERQAAEKAAERQAKADAEVEERRLRGGYLRNATRYPLEVTDCGERVIVLRPGQRAQTLEARCGYEGTMFVPSSNTAGVREDREAAFIVSDNAGGWVFYAPAVRQRGGR